MAELGLKEVVKMASNENPFGSSPKAQEALAELAGELHVYPDAMNEELRGRLSEKLDERCKGEAERIAHLEAASHKHER